MYMQYVLIYMYSVHVAVALNYNFKTHSSKDLKDLLYLTTSGKIGTFVIEFTRLHPLHIVSCFI